MITTVRLSIFFLLLSLGADAQIIRANAFYRPTAVAVSDTLILDSFPAAAGYSVRKLRTAYTGSCMRVRRTRNNAEQDIGFVNNFLDTASLISFANGSNLFVVTWYDQSGNGRDASQSTAANQPKIYDSATSAISKRNNKVSLSTDGGDRLDITTGLNLFQNVGYAYCFAVACNTTSTTIRYLMQATTNINATRFAVTYTRIAEQRNNILSRRLDADAALSLDATSNFSLTNLQLTSSIVDYQNTDAYIYRNGSSVASNTSYGTSGNTSNTASLSLYLFNVSGLGNGLLGSCSEIILYNTNESANRTKIENNINRNFLIY